MAADGRLHMLLAGLLVLLMSLGSVAYVSSNPQPAQAFAPGERLRYVLKWSVIEAGEAVLEVMPMASIDGQPVYHLRMTAESNAFVDLFYKVRDRIDSFMDQEITHTIRYLKKQHEGSRRRNITVEFDWNSQVAQYTDDTRTKTIRLVAGAFDPLAVFYYSRTLNFSENDRIVRPVTDGAKCIQGRAKIMAKERLHVAAGTFDTLLIEPEMEHIGGVFEKSKGAKIKLWVTADHRHIPVKIASKVVVGRFVGELVAIE